MARKTKTEARRAWEFAGLIAAIGVGGGIFAFVRHHPGRAALFGALGLAAPATAAVLPGVWLRLFRAWMTLANALSWVMTRVILSLFYFLVVTPFGVVRRVLGKSTLDAAWRDGKSSYWIDRTPTEASVERYSKRY